MGASAKHDINGAGHKRLRIWAVVICVTSLSGGCTRERRQFEPPPQATHEISMSELQPGSSTPPTATANAAEENAYAVAEGKRLYTAYNCAGCHFNGGGGIGPPLMDEKWIYGSDPQNVYSTIIEGRPNGMPSFRHKIPDSQVWEIAAYVRSLSGQVRKDVAPTRSDDMNAHRSEQRSERKTLQDTGIPKSAEQP